jgi:hypothetical protein
MSLDLLEQDMENLLVEIGEFSFTAMGEQESEKTLKGKKPGSYLFRKDSTGNFFLSGVNADGELHHAQIKKKESIWNGINGGHYQAKHLKKLVCLCLHCDDIQAISDIEG